MVWRWSMGFVLLSAMLIASAAATYSSGTIVKYGHGSAEQPYAEHYKLCKAVGETLDDDVSYLFDANVASRSAWTYQPQIAQAQTNAFSMLHAADFVAAFQNRGPPGFSLS